VLQSEDATGLGDLDPHRPVDKAVDNCVDSEGVPCGCDDVLIVPIARRGTDPDPSWQRERDLFHVKRSNDFYHVICGGSRETGMALNPAFKVYSCLLFARAGARIAV
jgi:hypothetical protein